MLQAVLTQGSGSSVADGDGGGDGGQVNDDGVELHHHLVEFGKFTWLNTSSVGLFWVRELMGASHFRFCAPGSGRTLGATLGEDGLN